VSLAPIEGYHKTRSPRRPRSHAGSAATALLAVIGDRELPDATLTEAQRRSIKRLVQRLAAGRSVHELMFLAGGFEDAARRRRAEETSGG
jgi:hypothetical protein